MNFVKGDTYICTHDIIINKELAFKSGYNYYCSDNDILIGNNQNKYNMIGLSTENKSYFEKPNNILQFKGIVNKMLDTYEKKNSDYGNSFDKSCDEFGPVAGIVRINDKFNRIKSLVNNDNKVKDESIEDTLLDLANYSIMLLMWFKNNKKK